MTTRCKFTLQRIERQISNVPTGEKTLHGHMKYRMGELRTLHFSPVYGNGDPDHENTKFWAASPQGQFTLGCVNLSAVDHMEIGKEYYLDITEAK